VAQSFLPSIIRSVLDNNTRPTYESNFLDLSNHATGTVLLVDVERLQNTQLASSTSPSAIYNGDFPTHEAYYLQAPAIELIRWRRFNSAQTGIKPGNIVIQKEVDADDPYKKHWEYSRSAWFGLVVQTPDGGRLYQLPRIAENTSFSMDTFHPASHDNTVVGQTTYREEQREIYGPIYSLERIKSVQMFNTAKLWDQAISDYIPGLWKFLEGLSSIGIGGYTGTR